MKKGSRVKFTMNNELLYGVVFKGGSNKITVILDGAKRTVSGHCSLFELSDHPIAKDEPNVMDKWGVVGYKTFRSLDGGGFNADITYNGKKVVTAFNEGMGGPTSFYNIKDGSGYVEMFRSNVDEWVKIFSDKKHIEADDSWLGWCVNEKPYGVTAKEFWGEWDNQVAEWDAKRKG